MQFITWPYTLRRGHTDNPAEGACAMDAVNWLVHGKHGDQPACACPIIGAYVIRGNDQMPNATRQRLLSYLHRIGGSRSPEHEMARLRIIVLGAVRIFAPLALDAASLPEQAAMLRALPDDVSFNRAAQAAGAAEPAAAWAAGAAERAALAAARAAQDAARAAQDAARAAQAAQAAQAAVEAAESLEAPAWNAYFDVLDAALNAGPQGSPFSADVMEHATRLYAEAASVQ
jgi:hypothetical protein